MGFDLYPYLYVLPYFTAIYLLVRWLRYDGPLHQALERCKDIEVRVAKVERAHSFYACSPSRSFVSDPRLGKLGECDCGRTLTEVRGRLYSCRPCRKTAS